MITILSENYLEILWAFWVQKNNFLKLAKNLRLLLFKHQLLVFLNHYASDLPCSTNYWMICVHVTMQYLIILFFKGTETPTNYIFGSIICQNALCCAICYTSIQIVNSRVWTFKILKQKIKVILETKPIFYRWETKIFEKNLSKIKISEYKSFFPCWTSLL